MHNQGVNRRKLLLVMAAAGHVMCRCFYRSAASMAAAFAAAVCLPASARSVLPFQQLLHQQCVRSWADKHHQPLTAVMCLISPVWLITSAIVALLLMPPSICLC
jgi:hypothetical protein